MRQLYKWTIHEETLDIPTFPGLDSNEVLTLFKDGRVASKFLERYFEKVFGWELIDTKNYDFLTPEGKKVEFKTLSKAGCNFSPSRMIGSGRKLEKKEATKIVLDNIYLICDITNFPKIKYILVEGKELIINYPSFHLKRLP